MTASDEKQFIQILEKRFKINKHLHEAINWENVRARLAVSKTKIPILYAMETTGGEPNVTGIDEISGEIIFMDCAIESPKGR